MESSDVSLCNYLFTLVIFYFFFAVCCSNL